MDDRRRKRKQRKEEKKEVKKKRVLIKTANKTASAGKKDRKEHAGDKKEGEDEGGKEDGESSRGTDSQPQEEGALYEVEGMDAVAPGTGRGVPKESVTPTVGTAETPDDDVDSDVSYDHLQDLVGV